MLVGARWLAGLLFRWSDLEILDDPIPPRLYCQHFRTKNHAPSLTELEGGEDPEQDDKSEGTTRCVESARLNALMFCITYM